MLLFVGKEMRGIWERYRKDEQGTVRKNRGGRLFVVLAFPDRYRVGMANLGLHLVYRLLNEQPDVVCERTFLPDPEVEAELRRTGKPLTTVESESPIHEADILAFSIPWELNYPGVLKILELSKIPLRAEERTEWHPMVIAGGFAVTMNPLPILPFLNFFALGFAEGVAKDLTSWYNWIAKRGRRQSSPERKQGTTLREKAIGAWFGEPGNRSLHRSKERSNDRSKGERRPLSFWLPARTEILTPHNEFGETMLLEIGRSCPWRCKFCATPPVYGRPLFAKLGQILRNIEEAPFTVKRVGLVSPTPTDHPEIFQICEALVERGLEFTLSSLRADSVSLELMRLIAKGGQRTITLAPETGTSRLAKFIGKKGAFERIWEAVAEAEEAGIRLVRLYFMVGLPTETEEDVGAIGCMLEKMSKLHPKVKFTASLGAFVPKPRTPFERSRMEPLPLLERKIEEIKRMSEGLPNVEVTSDSPRWAYIEAALSRGDERMAEVLQRAHELGGTFGAWRRAARELGVNLDSYALRERAPDEPLPWGEVASAFGG